MNQTTLLPFIKRHIPRSVFERMATDGIPLVGPTGLRRWLAERDLEAFAKLYFPDEFVLDTPGIHKELFADVEEVAQRACTGERGLKLARLIPRGHAKTTILVRLAPLHGLLYGWSPLTVLLANNSSAAERLLKNIKTSLETNPAIIEDFGDVKGAVWGADHIESKDGCTIYCFGRGSGAIRGVSNPRRPSLVLADDLDDDALVRSAIELEAATDWWDKAVLGIGDNITFRTSYIVAGTLIRDTSLLGHIIGQADFNTRVRRAIVHWPSNAALWGEWKSWFLEQARNDRAPQSAADDTFYQQHRDALNDGAEVLWPRLDQIWELQVKRISLGDAAFNSEFQNEPSATGGQLGILAIVDRLPDTNTEGALLLASLDTTTKGGKTNDRAAWVEAIYYPKRKQIYVTYVDSAQRPYNETIEMALNRLKSRPMSYAGIWIETNGSGWIVADLLDQRLKQQHVFYTPERVNNSAKKADRIAALPFYVGREQLFVLDGIAPELQQEFAGYPNFRFDDTIDALATILIQLKDRNMLALDVTPKDLYALS